MPLSLNHAPANGTNYRIFHGIRYLRCVVRAVRAAAGHCSRLVSEKMRMACHSCQAETTPDGGLLVPSRHSTGSGQVPLGTLVDCGECVCISGRSLARFS